MKLHHTAKIEAVSNYGTRLFDLKREINKLPPVFSDNAVVEARTGQFSVQEDVDAAEMERRLVPTIPVPEGTPTVDLIGLGSYHREVEAAIMELMVRGVKSAYTLPEISKHVMNKGVAFPVPSRTR